MLLQNIRPNGGPLLRNGMPQKNVRVCDLLLQCFDFRFMSAQQAEEAVVRETKTKEQRLHPISGRGLLPAFKTGNGHGLADALTQCFLRQSKLNAASADDLAKEHFLHSNASTQIY